MKLSQLKATCLLITGLILYSSSAVYSQPQMPSPPPVPDRDQIDRMVDDLTEALSLTEDQHAEILDLHLVHFKEEKELLEKEREYHEQMREKHEKLREEFESSLKSLLNEDQLAEFEKMKTERKHREHCPPRCDHRPPHHEK